MRKDGELFVRGVFDLRVRRKPQAFSAYAGSLWIFNHNILIINELYLYNATPSGRIYSTHTAQCKVRGTCGFVLTAIPSPTLLLAFPRPLVATNRGSIQLADDPPGSLLHPFRMPSSLPIC
jgi:hypothetical protein